MNFKSITQAKRSQSPKAETLAMSMKIKGRRVKIEYEDFKRNLTPDENKVFENVLHNLCTLDGFCSREGVDLKHPTVQYISKKIHVDFYDYNHPENEEYIKIYLCGK